MNLFLFFSLSNIQYILLFLRKLHALKIKQRKENVVTFFLEIQLTGGICHFTFIFYTDLLFSWTYIDRKKSYAESSMIQTWDSKFQFNSLRFSIKMGSSVYV